MAPPNTNDRYREARGIIEDLVAAWPGEAARAQLSAAQDYLRRHCQECGRALVGRARAEGDAICRICQPARAQPFPAHDRPDANPEPAEPLPPLDSRNRRKPPRFSASG